MIDEVKTDMWGGLVGNKYIYDNRLAIAIENLLAMPW